MIIVANNNVTIETLQKLQGYVILGTGNAASAQDMLLYEALVDEDGGVTAINVAVDSFMDELASQIGPEALIKAIAMNGLGLELSDAEVAGAIQVMLDLGISTWSGLFTFIVADEGEVGATINMRSESAVYFTGFLDSAGESSLSVDFAAGTTVTGPSAKIIEAYEPNSAKPASVLGNEALKVTDSGELEAAVILELDALTSGRVTVDAVTTLTGTITQITAAYAANSTGAIGGLGNESVTISGTDSVSAEVLGLIDILTSGPIDAGSITTLTGTPAQILALYASNGAGTIIGLGNEKITISGTGSVSAEVLSLIDTLTSGPIDASAITTLTGTAAQISEVYASDGGGSITGLGNETLVPSDVESAAPAVLAALGLLTSGDVVVTPTPIPPTSIPTPTDTLAPTIAITNNVVGTASGDVTYTFNLSEASTTFAAGDITVAGGTAGTFTAVSSTQYTLVVTPPAGSTTSITVDVAGGAFTDIVGLDNIAATQNVQAVDTAPLTIAITDNSAGTAAGDVTYTFTLSEASTTFAAGDITVAGGTAGAFKAVSSTQYTLVVTPPANSTGNITVDVAGGAFTDAAGNNNTAAIQSVQAFDTAVPTIAITDNAV
ncbi:MAG: hypothetical protein ACI9WR_001502, partial [Paracoccaceae bacterium]